MFAYDDAVAKRPPTIRAGVEVRGSTPLGSTRNPTHTAGLRAKPRFPSVQHKVHSRNFCRVRTDDREDPPRTSVVTIEEGVGRHDECLDGREQFAVRYLPTEVPPEHLDGVQPGAVSR